MNDTDTIDIVNDRVFNEQVFNAIMESPDGLNKEAGASTTRFIRRQLRENAFCRKVLNFDTVTDAQLVKLPTQEMPILWGELESDSPGARSISFKDTADTEFFWRRTWIVQFFVITTPEYSKNTFELKGHVNDTVKILTENNLKDMETEEDRRFLEEVDDNVGSPGTNGAAGYPQAFYVGPFTRDSHVKSQFLLSDRRLPNGVFLANQRFIGNFQTLNRTEIGGDLSQDLFKEGGAAIKNGIIGGIPHLFTIKNDLVANNHLYQFTEPGFLGVAAEYQKPTLYVKKEKHTLFFSADEIIGVTLANVAGMAKSIFEYAT